jgi:hypothetical protein
LGSLRGAAKATIGPKMSDYFYHKCPGPSIAEQPRAKRLTPGA